MDSKETLRATPDVMGHWRWTTAGEPVFAHEDDMAGPRLGRPARVLIVEDDHLVAMHIEAALLDAGFEVVGIAATAEEATALASTERPVVAIMDIRLSGARDGVDAALGLFKQFGLRSIFATAHQDAGTRLRAEPAHPLGWLSKPYQPDALVHALRRAFDELDT